MDIVLQREIDVVKAQLKRNGVVTAQGALGPMGIAPEDYELVRELDRAPFLFEPGDGRFHMIYAGALLPAGIAVLAELVGMRIVGRAGGQVDADQPQAGRPACPRSGGADGPRH